MSSEESSQLLARSPHVTVVASAGAGAGGGTSSTGTNTTDTDNDTSAPSTSSGPYLVRTPTVTVEAAPSSGAGSSASSVSGSGSAAPAGSGPGGGAGVTGGASGRRGSVNPAVLVGAVTSSKPVLMRQDCTTFLHSGLGLGLGGSEESAASGCVEDTATRSVPDLELHCRLTGQDGPCQGQVVPCRPRGSVSGAGGYHLLPHAHSRCRGCDTRCDHRCESAMLLLPGLPRSVSRESMRSGCYQASSLTSGSAGAVVASGGVSGSSSGLPPAVLLTASPNSSRIIRQSSQPESHCAALCYHHQTSAPSSSLRQLQLRDSREPGENIAMIAADSLRFNGAIRQFKQGILLCPQTLSQARRERLRRAFTDATSETVTYVKTVGVYVH